MVGNQKLFSRKKYQYPELLWLEDPCIIYNNWLSNESPCKTAERATVISFLSRWENSFNSSVRNTRVIVFADHLAVTKLAAKAQTGSEPRRCSSAPIMIRIAQQTSRQVLIVPVCNALCLMGFYPAPAIAACINISCLMCLTDWGCAGQLKQTLKSSVWLQLWYLARGSNCKRQKHRFYPKL